jgi:hypothetical protein
MFQSNSDWSAPRTCSGDGPHCLATIQPLYARQPVLPGNIGMPGTSSGGLQLDTYVTPFQ